ncbi:MAG TPA: hypothetical protein DCL63_00860 [Firmicutes bacterium]|nr:hypothetical protein [Bacillota bacterium]
MLSVGNERIRIEIDDLSGGVAQIQDLAARDDVIKYASAAGGAPFEIVCLDGQGRRASYVAGPVAGGRALAGNALYMNHDHVVRAGCESPDCAGRADISCRWQVDVPTGPDGASSWSISIDNNTDDLTVVEVLFPMVRGIQLGPDSADEVLVFPHHAGEKIVNPADAIASDRYMRFWRAGTALGANGVYHREINYCGLASMTWMDLYASPSDGRSFGLYMASHDPSFVLTGVRSETGGPNAPWCGLGFRKYVPVRRGESWESAPFALEVHDGDWHFGARRYRQWIRGRIDLSAVPEDLAMQSSMCPRYDFKNGQAVHHRYDEIPRMYEQARAEGITHFFISGWNRQGFDTDYPEFVPDMELGGAWDLAQGCEYVRDHGGFSTFYINVRLFDLESDFFPTLGRSWSIKNHDNSMFRETYGPRSFAVICPDCGKWRKWVADTAGWMVKAFGARGIYLDQLGSAEPFPCYDTGHAHAHHGLYNQGYLKMIRQVRDRLLALDPSSFLMVENCGDIYSQHVYANLTWNGSLYDEFFNVYKYTFPEFIQVNMVNPRRIADKAERSSWFYRDVARAFVLGSVFWSELGDRFGEEDGDLLDHFRAALRLRQHAAAYIARGVYQDDLGLEFERGADDSSPTAPPAIAASRWLLPDGPVLTLISNPRQLSGLEIRIDGPEEGAWTDCANVGITCRTLCGEQTESVVPADGNGRVTLEIPASGLSFFAVCPRGGETDA